MKILSYFKKTKHAGYWTYRRIKDCAETYSSRTEFARNEPSAYSIAKDKQILDLVLASIPRKIEAWSFPKAKFAALNYSKRTHFRKYARGAYEFAKQTGTLNTICKHMETYPDWTFEAIVKQAKKYPNYSSWYNAKGSGGKKASRIGWTKEIKRLAWGKK